MDTTETVRDYYNSTVQEEWERIADRPEFIITVRFIGRYIKPGDRVLDIGGGPGRYSLYLAGRGCDVTLFDLSDKNTEFAAERAKEQRVALKTVCGDAREADMLTAGEFDCVLLMGPLYHLLSEDDRTKAVNAALKRLKPGGVLFASFINMFSGVVFAMKFAPELICEPSEREFFEIAAKNGGFSGDAFTKAHFTTPAEILPFMERFPLEKLHFIGQEGISSPCEKNIMSQPKPVIDAWMDFCERTCERPDLLSWSEHLMYIGRKKQAQ